MTRHWLAHYFRELATEWEGWSGSKNWEGDGLRIEATHNHVGAVVLLVTIDDGLWTCSGPINFEPGKLATASSEISEFFGVPRNGST